MNYYIVTKRIRANNIKNALKREPEGEILGIGIEDPEEDDAAPALGIACE